VVWCGVVWCGEVKIQFLNVQKPQPSYIITAEQALRPYNSACFPAEKAVFDHPASIRGKPVFLHSLCKRTLPGIKAAMRDTILVFCVCCGSSERSKESAPASVLSLDAPIITIHQATARRLCQNKRLSHQRESVSLLNTSGLSFFHPASQRGNCRASLIMHQPEHSSAYQANPIVQPNTSR
jgi:hypothetical protein